ncbi:hypothetical protein BGX20_007131, partial [Mortierella sp. AD010]
MPKEKKAKTKGTTRQNPVRGSSKASKSNRAATSSSSFTSANQPTSSSFTTANRPPSMETENSTVATKLKLFCIVENESTSFSVEILDIETVDDLKKVIKTAKSNDLSKIDADRLTLWKASIPIAE